MAEVYPSNSNRAKESSLVREPIETRPTEAPKEDTHPRVTTPTVRQRKISPVKEVFAAIFPGGFAEVKEHLVWDIFVPWMQDMLKSGWDGLGEVIFPGSNRNPKGRMPEHYSYDAPYRYGSVSYDTPGRYYNEMPPMHTKQEAWDVLCDLRGIWREYHVVTLLDFNERVGNKTHPTQANYGWLNLDSAQVERTRDGWIISMPRAVAIDNVR